MHPETGHERSYTIEIVPARNTEIPIKRLLSNYQNHPHNDDDEQMKRAMQAVEVILKAAFHQDHLHTGIQGGRSFYLPIANRPYLGDFSELWLGLFQSLVLGEVAFLNVDVNHKAFPKRYGSLVDLLRDMRMNIDPSRGIHRDVEFALAKHLGGLEICYNGKGQKRIYKFVEIARKPNDVKFILENGQETSVLQYFQSIGRHIEYPNLPCIRLGNTIKSHIVPMEFCSIPDRQVINKKCTKNQTSAIIKQAATSTDDRKAKIMELIRKISHNQSPVIRGFGMQVGSDFEKVPIRQLEAPKLVYGGNKTVQPQTGVWRGENMQFLMPKTRVQWAILNTNDKTSRIELKELAEKLQQYSVPTGLQLAAKPVTIQSYGETHKIEAFLHKVGQGQQIHIVFVVIPASGSNYSKIKQMAEINYGVLTQCIKSGTVLRKRKESSTISNILLKVNAKLNGTNHKLQASPILTAAPGKVMVIGADVTHPSPEQRSIPSIVGVAASHDHNAFCYNMCWRLQAPKLEIIQDFKEICKNHLKIFKQKNGAFPEKILYYRDGVSEGQFDEVMAVEKRAMSEACREVEQGYDKKVGAKISDDFQKKESKTGPTRPGNNNVPAGTVVDTVIIRPMENNFFLVSHQSIQGVAKPTKYCILLDQANYSTNDLQSLTFNVRVLNFYYLISHPFFIQQILGLTFELCLSFQLCHMFARCNRSVSYPAPTYYAHLVAARGKVYI
ncbi:Protein argonaute-2, partial [Pseudolycoriella hygida]